MTLEGNQKLIEMDMAYVMEYGVHRTAFIEHILTNTLSKTLSQMNDKLIKPIEDHVLNSRMDLNTKVDLLNSLYKHGWYPSLSDMEGFKKKMKSVRNMRNLLAHSYTQNNQEFIKNYNRTVLKLIYLDVNGYKTVTINLTKNEHDPYNDIYFLNEIQENVNFCADVVTSAQKDIDKRLGISSS